MSRYPHPVRVGPVSRRASAHHRDLSDSLRRMRWRLAMRELRGLLTAILVLANVLLFALILWQGWGSRSAVVSASPEPAVAPQSLERRTLFLEQQLAVQSDEIQALEQRLSGGMNLSLQQRQALEQQLARLRYTYSVQAEELALLTYN